jgi:hypothetical protein
VTSTFCYNKLATHSYIMAESAPNPLFSSVGAQVDDEKHVDEIESLCMNCHEDVSYLHRLVELANIVIGNNQASPYQNTLLSRDSHYVVSM